MYSHMSTQNVSVWQLLPYQGLPQGQMSKQVLLGTTFYKKNLAEIQPPSVEFASPTILT